MTITIKLACVVLMFVAISCKKPVAEIKTAAPAYDYNQQHRPQTHFSPQSGWMNDPNGMFYLDGEFHLFYQHYPDSTVWGPMHWGHAVTRDLIHWEHLPIALYPDSLGYIFSGSAVVDTQNTSGFGSNDNPAVVAIFTYHDTKGVNEGRNNFQSQAIAYSTDKGRTWTKYKGNPIVSSPGIRDFRDPKVSWIEDANQWIMTLAVTDHIEFYGSPDLKAWTKLSEFGQKEGAHRGVWECPDLFKLVDENEQSKYVLLVSINPGGPNGGSGTQYFVGDFDGKKFTSDTPGENAGWIDYGTDNYAGVTWSNAPGDDRRKVFIGWMSNWMYAEVVPTKTWRSAMTIPRTLTLQTSGKGHILKSDPVSELNQLIIETESFHELEEDDTVNFWNDEVPIMLGGEIDKADFEFELGNSNGQNVIFGFDGRANVFYLDRSASVDSVFHQDFGRRMVAPRVSIDDKITFVVVIDVASVELFFDDGRTSMTAITFPDKVFDYARLYSRDGTVSLSHLEVHRLKSIWTTGDH